MASTRFITALEHQPLPITADGSAWSITPAEAERLARIGEERPGFCEVGHRRVKLAQFCGVVGLGERVLEVLPKIQDDTFSAEECRGVLLRMLRLTGRIPQFQHQAVGQHLRRAPLLEAFIAAFFEAVSVLTRGGLLKQYLGHEEDLSVVRGSIAVARQLGVHANRPDLVACAFDELTIDNVWNRTLKKALRCTRPWIRSVELNRQWIALMGLMQDVDDTRLSSLDVERLTFNRHAERYRVAIDWARWILALLAPALRAGRSEAPALLFDMNQLFESAVATVASRRAHAQIGGRVDVQDTSRTLTTFVSVGCVETAYKLRPDLVFSTAGQVTGIVDSKYKRLSGDKRGRLIPSEADMYQMHAYASAYRCAELSLVYPWHSGLANVSDTEFRLPNSNGLAPIVTVICIDIGDDELPTRIGRWPGTRVYSDVG